MRYNGTNVPPAGSPNEPQHEFFTRQFNTDYFFAWKYNDIIDNIWALSQKIFPFWIAGCNISYSGGDAEYYYYNISEGFIFSKGLVYVNAQTILIPVTNDIFVIRIDKNGNAVYIDLNSYNFNSDINNGICKIGYVCVNSVRMEPQNYYMFLKNAPLTQYIYGAYNFYNGYGRYQ